MIPSLNKATRMSSARFHQIEEIAQEVRRQGIIRWAAVYQEAYTATVLYPLWVEVEALCFIAVLLTGGTVTSVRNLCVDGERLAGGIVWQGNGSANIVYEAYDPWVRQRFSIAHELGHFFLHEAIILAQGGRHNDPSRPDDENGERDSIAVVGTDLWEDDPVMESEADAFAAAFLMPAALVIENIAHFGHAIPFLATQYGVSHAALRKRIRILKECGSFDKGAV